MTFKGPDAQGKEAPQRKPRELGDEILELLELRTKNPSDAFVLLQHLCVYLWDTYKIDWESKVGSPVSPERKVRYLQFVAGLIDQVTENSESEAPPAPENKSPESK